MKQLEEIKARASAATPGPWHQGREAKRFESVKEVYSEREPSRTSEDLCTAWYPEDADFIESARTDVPRLVAALEATLAWCDLLQYPTTDYPEGFSLQDYALDDAARRVRAAITEALEAV